MKFFVAGSFVLGLFSFLSLSVRILGIDVDISDQSYDPRIRRTHHLATRAEHVDGNSSPVNSLGSAEAAWEPKLHRRAWERWTPDEEELLLELREQQRLSWKEILEYFPTRNWRALAAKYHKLTHDSSTIGKKTAKRPEAWTREEHERLVELREMNVSWDELTEIFPGRSVTAIKSQYYRLTSPTPKDVIERWTAEEDSYLSQLGEEGLSWDERETLFNTRFKTSSDRRTLGALQARYSYLRPSARNVQWTTEQDNYLLQLGEEGLPWNERTSLFNARFRTPSTRRTSGALQKRYSLLVTSKPARKGAFTPEEDDEIIKALNSGIPVEEIFQTLKRGKRSVKRRIKQLKKLNRVNPELQVGNRRTFTDADFKLIHELRNRGLLWKDITTNHFPEQSITGVRVAYREYYRKEDERK